MLLMYECETCGNLFDESEMGSFWDQDRGFVNCCANCGSEEFHLTDRCNGCGEWRDVEDMTEGFCNDCKTEILKRLTNFIIQNFDHKEIQLLREFVDEEVLA